MVGDFKLNGFIDVNIRYLVEDGKIVHLFIQFVHNILLLRRRNWLVFDFVFLHCGVLQALDQGFIRLIDQLRNVVEVTL